ncbi:hypothetical protein BJX65DRAFT_307733 [Aspergillus insuetus]
MSDGNHALIFGATGISGWSLMKQCLSYPSPTSFNRVTGLCNRPVNREDLFLPDDARLNIVSGIDLTAPLETVIRELGKVESIKTVNIVFFCAYIQTPDHASLRKVNTALLHTAVQAVTSLSPNLQTIILQTGGKGYGLEFPDSVAISPPLHESLPRIPEPYASKIFYYTQYDLLAELSKTAKWTFSEIRPDGIVGFAPGSNAMNMAQGIAFYLSLWREVYGAGAACPFPGRKRGWTSAHSDTFQDVLSKAEIYVAVNRHKCGDGSVFNAADGETVTWEGVWPRICESFGLVGIAPLAEGDSQKETMEAFVGAHGNEWSALATRFGLREGMLEKQNWGHTHFMLVDFDFDREYSLDKIKGVGFDGWIDTVEGYKVAFERMVEARLIPRPLSSA